MIERIKNFFKYEKVQIEGKKQPLPKYVIRNGEEKEAVYYCSGCQEYPDEKQLTRKVVVPYYCDSCRNIALRDYMTGADPKRPIIR